MKTPTLAALRLLAKRKGLLSWPCIRLDNQAGGAWHESWARIQVFRFNETPSQWRALAKSVIFAALNALPDAKPKGAK